MNSKNNSGLFKDLRGNQKYTLTLMAFLAVLLVICLIIIVIASIDFKPKNQEEPAADINSFKIENTETRTISEIDLYSGALMVVNKDHKFTLLESELDLIDAYEYRVSQDEAAGATESAYKFNSASGVSSNLSKDTTENLHNMLTALNKEKGTVSYISVAYRSFEDQKNDKPAPSQYSDFHTGMLVSLQVYVGSSQRLDLGIKETMEEYNWFLQHAHEYGFVQRYPEGKEQITGVTDYISCFRYVGVAHATYMKNNNLCLEEYIDFIQNTKKPTIDEPFRIEVKNGNQKEYYAIYYYDGYTGGATDIQVPTQNDYTISATNTGGIIVTVKLK